LNPVRNERSSSFIYAFVEKKPTDQVSKPQADLLGNTCELHGKRTAMVASLRFDDEYQRSEVAMTLDLQPGESRGYWKYQALQAGTARSTT
jgi:hypothetical protein